MSDIDPITGLPKELGTWENIAKEGQQITVKLEKRKFGKAYTVITGINQNEVDELSGVYVHHSIARLDKGIPNPKHRPTLPTPWELEFDFELYPNREIKEQEIINLLEEAGKAIGIGTWRGRFGKFYVESWDEI